MLTGKLPFRGDHDQTVIYSILHQEPESLTRARPGSASGLEQIVRRAMAKKPTDRYQTMEEFLEDLAAVAEGLRPLRAKPARTIFGIRTAYAYSALAVVLTLILGLNIGGLRNRLIGGASRVERAVKLAVLPFANLTGDPEQEYLNDGLSQEMITLLGRLHSRSLGVIARTSVMRYKKTGTPVNRIGRELGVDYVLEGSARREAGRIRVAVELIQVRDQTQLWADVFEREMTGIQSLQNEVAGRVVGALGLKLLPAERALLANARAVDPAAYEAYLMGRLYLYMDTASAATVEKSIEYFRQASDRDPKFAAAYAGLAVAWGLYGQMASLPTAETASQQRNAAQKALAIDDTLAEGYVALGSASQTDWDWEGAEREFKRAIELNPNFADAHLWYSQLLGLISLNEEALSEIKRARELDPLNPFIAANVLWRLYYLGRYDEAIADSRKLLEIYPNKWLNHWTRGYLYSAKGMYEEAIVEHRKALALSEGSLECLPDLGYALAKAGKTTEALKVLDKLREESKKKHVPAGLFVMVYLGLGERDKAFQSLERAYEERDMRTGWLLIDPLLGPFRSDPRFQDLKKKMRLDQRRGL
jgi:TolB-like protein/Flp pilus assembly protein TadD